MDWTVLALVIAAIWLLRHFAIARQARLFRAKYAQLSRIGVCDTPGGVEYLRVYLEWVKAGRPAEIANFIRHRANHG